MHDPRPIIAMLLIVATAAVAAADDPIATSEEVMSTPSADSTDPVVLLIQGRLAPGGEAVYQKYLDGTGPLMAEYGATVEMVGHGVSSEHTTDAWPVNAMLRFPSRAAAEAFLADPRYLEIKRAYRDQAYETLHLTLVETRAPRVRTPRAVAEEAFRDLRNGLATGTWGPFLARLSDDFTFHFPLGKFQGLNEGKQRAAEFFAFVSQVYPEGLEIEKVHGITAEGNRVVFEFEDRGLMFGKPYHNLVAISLDVCGELICGYREYFGLVGPPPSQEDGS
jgi:uncharacterized protein (DUF1330 family)